MAQTSKPSVDSGGLRFGDFTVDLHIRELHRNGARIRLQEQPFQVLALLTRRAGDVVTREELRQHLWPADTFVDFDNSLNASIAKIREALGDSPECPRFIETLPRRGYRFIAAVNAIDEVLDKPIPSSAALPVQFQVEWRANRRVLAAIGLGLTVITAGVLLWALKPLRFPKVVRYVQITSDGKPKTRPVSFINILLTDGYRVYFALGTRKGWELAEVSAAGGEAVTIPAPVEGIIPCDISPDHSKLLLAGGTKGTELPGSAYWVLQLPGGPVERLGDVRARGASWSPDGKRLAYAQQDSLYVANADGSEARRLATYDPRVSQPFQPRWSPEAKVLRFYLFDVKRGSGELWEISVDGTNAHALFPNWPGASETCCGLWTSDGKYFVFQATHNNVTDIWVRREQSGFLSNRPLEPVQLTFGPMNFLAPTPSPDGKHLFAIGGQERGELMHYDSVSGQFVTYLSGISAEGLDFSRDGESVLYTAFPEGTMWRSRVDGSERVQVSPPSWRAAYPRWSPDGSRVAFMGAKSEGDWRIYLIRSEGGSPEPLLESEELQLHPNWSPNGNAVIFGNPWWAATPAIHLVDVAAHRASILPNSQGLYSPSWSPDGRFVAAISKDLRRIVLFDFTTQRWDEIAVMDSVGHLAWSRKGEYVYFDAATKGSVSIYRVEARSHRVERIAEIPPHLVPPFELFSPWTGLAPDDSPLLMRDTSVQEIYALDLQLP